MNKVLQGLDFACCILVWFCHIQQKWTRTSRTLGNCLQETPEAGLKLKESKCDFFLGPNTLPGPHAVSANGIQPLREKLDSITQHPSSWKSDRTKAVSWSSWATITKFVPHAFWTYPDHWWSWWERTHHLPGQSSVTLPLQCWKDELCKAPILQYPNSNKPYTLFTDASKHGMGRHVLTQEFKTEVNG